jgi:hypothetical protein
MYYISLMIKYFSLRLDILPVRRRGEWFRGWGWWLKY